MATYRVRGPNPYRGHQPGDLLIGELEPASAARALALGVIELINDEPIRLDPERVTPPPAPRPPRARLVAASEEADIPEPVVGEDAIAADEPPAADDDDSNGG